MTEHTHIRTSQPLLFSFNNGFLKHRKKIKVTEYELPRFWFSHLLLKLLFIYLFIFHQTFLSRSNFLIPTVLQRSINFLQAFVSAIFNPFHCQLVLFHCLFTFRLQIYVNLPLFANNLPQNCVPFLSFDLTSLVCLIIAFFRLYRFTVEYLKVSEMYN